MRCLPIPNSLLLLLLLLLPLQAWASDYVCGTDTALRAYLLNRDPSQVSGQADCSAVPKAEVQAQRAFLAAHPDGRTLRVVDGLLALKEQADLDALAAADAAAQAAVDAKTTEVGTNPLCNATLGDINTKIDTLIDPIANLADAKAALKVGLRQVARCLIAIR